MRYLKTIILLWVTVLSCLTANAQSNHHYILGSAGGSVKLSNGWTMEFSLGEIAIETIGTTTKFTQGFLQPIRDTEPPKAPSTPLLATGSDTGVDTGDGITSDNTPTFTGTAEVGSTVTLYSTAGAKILGTAIALDGNWEITTTELADGRHSINATATDAAKNVSAASPSVSVTIDTTAPVISAINITSDNAVPAYARVFSTVTMTFSVNESVIGMPSTLAGLPAILSPTVPAGNNWSVSHYFTDTDTYTEGVISFTISVKDIAGNLATFTTTDVPSSIVFDSKPPAAPINIVATTDDKKIILTWSDNTETDLEGYRIIILKDGIPDALVSDIPAGTTSYSITGLDNGTTYEYGLLAFDKAGNPSGITPISATPKGDQTINALNFSPKTYGDASFELGDANSSANLPIDYSSSNSSIISISGNIATILKAGTVEISANQGGNTSINPAIPVKQLLKVDPKPIIVTADDKEKNQGNPNPELTVSYSAFAYNDTEAVITTLPTTTTTSVTTSLPGNYPITTGGAIATNYTFTYKPGNLKVIAAIPTDISLSAVTLYENLPAGTNVGNLSTVSDDLSGIFTYTLVSGSGSADNALFTIISNKINTTRSLDFESKSIYSVRIKTTSQDNRSYEKVITIALSDVNEAPTLDHIANQSVCIGTANHAFGLSGISTGPETSQLIYLSVSSSNPDLFETLSIVHSGGNGSINYQLKAGALAQVVNITVVVKDDGKTDNGGIDTYSQTFSLTVNPLPTVSISSDKGLQVSKGEAVMLSATGGSNYVWTANGSTITGQTAATLQIRAMETTTYSVIAVNASGCSDRKAITLTVLDDMENIKATNILSPNGDGYNDVWVIDNIDLYPNSEVKIFDRAGRTLYIKKGYDNTWDGTFNGNALGEDTYYYIINFGPNKRVLKGFITIVRND